MNDNRYRCQVASEFMKAKKCEAIRKFKWDVFPDDKANYKVCSQTGDSN